MGLDLGIILTRFLSRSVRRPFALSELFWMRELCQDLLKSRPPPKVHVRQVDLQDLGRSWLAPLGVLVLVGPGDVGATDLVDVAPHVAWRHLEVAEPTIAGIETENLQWRNLAFKIMVKVRHYWFLVVGWEFIFIMTAFGCWTSTCSGTLLLLI